MKERWVGLKEGKMLCSRRRGRRSCLQCPVLSKQGFGGKRTYYTN